MDKEDSKKSIWGRVKSFWNSVPEFLKLIGTILSIALALKALFPAAVLEISDFDASPEIIESGGSSTLSWKVSGADNITIDPGIGAVSSNGSVSVSPPETTTYELTATTKGKEKVALRTVTVNEGSQEPLLINSFSANPDFIKPGENSVLNWHVSGVSNVTIEPGIGIVEPAGTLKVSPASTTTYKLTASNGDKEDVIYCTVTVEENSISPENVSPSSLPSEEESLTPQKNPVSSENVSPSNLPSVSSFNAKPDAVGKGESSNLVWNVSKASKVSIEPGIGTVGLTGSQRIFPDETTTYTLTATNEFGSVDATKVVFVKEPSTPATQEPGSTSGSTPSNAPISVPEQLSPADGTELDSSMSRIALEWKAVPDAASYTVEIDEYDTGSGRWLSESVGSRIKSGITTTSYSYESQAKMPCRWRVWAVGPDGQESEKTGWWDFSYIVNSSQNNTQ